MEFVDYKCLETLLNEGEEIIVTEGIVSAIRGIIGRVFGMFKNFIDMIIRVFRNLIDRLKSKHSKKNSTQDQDQSNKSEVVPNKSEEPNKGSSAQVSTGFVKDITTATNSISSLTNTIYKSFDTVFKNFGTEDVNSELIDNLEDKTNSTNQIASEFSEKYNGKQVVITEDDKNTISYELNDAISALAKYKKRTDKFVNANSDEGDLRPNEKILMVKVTKSISTAQNLANAINKILDKAIIQ